MQLKEIGSLHIVTSIESERMGNKTKVSILGKGKKESIGIQ